MSCRRLLTLRDVQADRLSFRHSNLFASTAGCALQLRCTDCHLHTEPFIINSRQYIIVPSAQAYAAKQRAKEDEREAQEAAQRAEVERAEAERRAAEDAEADKWMGMISTEGEGTEEAALQEESQVKISVLKKLRF